FTVGDLETPAENLILMMTSSNTNLIAETNILLSGTGMLRSLHLLPATNQSGTATLTIRVSDDQGLTAADSFVLTVIPVDEPPILAPLANITTNAGAGPQSIPLLGLGAGAPNEVQILTVTATSSAPSLIPDPTITYLNPQTTGTLSLASLPNANGTATIMVTGDDGQTANH